MEGVLVMAGDCRANCRDLKKEALGSFAILRSLRLNDTVVIITFCVLRMSIIQRSIVSESQNVV